MNISQEKLKEMLKTMLLIRHFETSLEELFFEGQIQGAAHLSIGQESSAVGVIFALDKKDFVFSNHRGHGHCIAKGLDVKKMMAELWGKSTGYCKGKGGSMHIMDLDKRLMGTSGIVGGAIGLANGPAFNSNFKNTKEVSVAYFGDGGSNQGIFHEALNLASIWKLPTIFVLENNHYAEATCIEYTCNIKSLSDRATSYGILGLNADGSDVLDVYKKASEAITRARNGEGPTLLVIDVYRYKGHEVGEPEGYRTKEEISQHMANDCIENFKNYLINNKYLIEDDYININDDAKKLVSDAIKFAEESSFPDLSELYKDVYV
jgi:acetoin:2,6-dichlorophenolindophenol oxidoreductase subunit alpha